MAAAKLARKGWIVMLKIAVITRYFPSSAEPWQGRSAYQTLRALACKADVRVFYPNAAYPSWLKPRSRSYDQLNASYSPPDVKVDYYDFPALPLVSRPFNGWMAARVLLPHVRDFAPDLIFSYLSLPGGVCRSANWQSPLCSGSRQKYRFRHQPDRRSHFGHAHAHGSAGGRFSSHG